MPVEYPYIWLEFRGFQVISGDFRCGQGADCMKHIILLFNKHVCTIKKKSINSVKNLIPPLTPLVPTQ